MIIYRNHHTPETLRRLLESYPDRALLVVLDGRVAVVFPKQAQTLDAMTSEVTEALAQLANGIDYI